MKFPEQFRTSPSAAYASRRGDTFGCFVIPAGGDRLLCIVGDHDEPDIARWEHVSVSVRNKRMLNLNRCPTWEQMCLVKDLFWPDTETVMQIHPPRSDYVNNHQHCLHLWRPIEITIPLPPSIFVGVAKLGVLPGT